jgi:hypothetical protein
MAAPSAPEAVSEPDLGRPQADSDLSDVAIRLLRGLPRPIRHPQLAGFLGQCRAHPLASAALDYVERKQEQAERTDQRLEHQFWERLRGHLIELHSTAVGDDGEADRAAGRRATLLAQHLVAENLLRLALTEDSQRAAPPRRGPRPIPTARTGGERD